ncbi:lymphatic vessel endothelial hyaluronic receptor 1b [Osmerus eperlanus]|uniref:lymphatic vessel endothelial hyaluronic receptor 1b n=1 Tax=Osmerus eperlanus TaxID=29151 RepID=UPI002E14071E
MFAEIGSFLHKKMWFLPAFYSIFGVFTSLTMARFWLFAGIFLTLVVYTLPFNHSQITVFPESGGKAEVFMVSVGDKYAFNMSQAQAVCLFLNATIATKAQVEKALQHGLETCKFGWIHEQIVVIPRIRRNVKCGQNKTGVVPWNVPGNKIFSAFCYKPEETPTTPEVPATKSTAYSTPATTTAPHLVKSTPKVPVLTKLTTQVSNISLTASTASPLAKSAFSNGIISTVSSSRSSLSSTIPLPHFLMTSSDSLSRSASPRVSTPSSDLSSISSPFSLTNQTGMPVFSTTMISFHESPFGALSTTFLTLAIILLLLAATAAVWFYKMNKNVVPFWPRRHLKDDIETEMWKNTDSEMDLHNQPKEEGVGNRKY